MISIVYMGNNLVGLEILKWLKSRNESVVALVVHPPEKRKYGEEIIHTSGLTTEFIFFGTDINKPDFLNRVREMKPDLILSIFFDYILGKELIEIPHLGCINLHPACLPYNRGQFPNVWSIVEETPAGATLHYIDGGIDTGDIIARKEVRVDFTDTGESLYRKLEKACIELFKDNWEAIKNGTNKRIAQLAGGTYHATKDVREIDEIRLDKMYEAAHLLNILRARTFPPYESAYVILDDGRKVYIRVSLEEAQE